eukprot:UN13505
MELHQGRNYRIHDTNNRRLSPVINHRSPAHSNMPLSTIPPPSISPKKSSPRNNVKYGYPSTNASLNSHAHPVSNLPHQHTTDQTDNTTTLSGHSGGPSPIQDTPQNQKIIQNLNKNR